MTSELIKVGFIGDKRMNKQNKENPHTVKKFELVEGYVKSWVQKLMNYKKVNSMQCKEIVFIDCMCNNGIYIDTDGNCIEGTPIRVAKVILEAMKNYPDKKATLYFNDQDAEKINALKKLLPDNTNNFQIHLSNKDGNALLKELKPLLLKKQGVHYLLFYDPFKAAINWEALAPYFFGWGEVILNHVVSDTKRAITSAKRPEAINKYEQTYLTTIAELVNLRGDKNAYEERIKTIIQRISSLSNREHYLAVFPFFIKTNAQIYSIIFFTKNIAGFKLFKKMAWKTFGDKSSNQNTHGREIQQSLFNTSLLEDKQCYYVNDIVNYIIETFKSRGIVLLNEVWNLLDEHPVFPTDGYKNEIKKKLKQTGHCNVSNSAIVFA